MRRRGGHSLVEVLVAMVLAEVGLLAVVATLLLASGTLDEAERRERSVLRVQTLLDSMATSSGAGGGTATEPWGSLTWTREPGGDVRVVVRATGLPVYRVDSWIPGPVPLP